MEKFNAHPFLDLAKDVTFDGQLIDIDEGK